MPLRLLCSGSRFPIGNDCFPLAIISFLSVTSSTHQSKEHTGPKGWVKKTETTRAALGLSPLIYTWHQVSIQGRCGVAFTGAVASRKLAASLDLKCSGTRQPKCAGVVVYMRLNLAPCDHSTWDRLAWVIGCSPDWEVRGQQKTRPVFFCHF